MKHIGGFILLSLVLTLGYFVGLLKFLTENEEDKCDMTFMFEYPQYVKISNKADKIFKKYGLYAYSEGRLTEKTRNMYFNGIPVLFIPGNKGSHKQVRSLSSVALRKWLNSRVPFHFDYFTVDLNEEYSGLYGPLLYDQLQYVNASLYRILELYQKRKDPPKSIVLVGHSMGGIIAMKLLSATQDPDLVPILIMLATPLKRLPVFLDYRSKVFYTGIFSNDFSSTTIVNVAGGYKDLLISPFLTNRPGNDILHVMSSHIPISWTESNHVQILWCKQVVMALNRALFDSVDTRISQISSNSTYRKMVFHHHLAHHSGINIKYHQNYLKSVQMNEKGKWIESLRKQYSVGHLNGLNEIQWYMIAITNYIGYEKLSILAINMEIVDWIFACNAYFIKDSSRICREGYHMSQKSEIAPSVKYKRRFINLDLKSLKKERPEVSHIVFRALPTDDPLEYHVDVHGHDQRFLTVQLPNWYSFKKQTIIEKTVEKAVYYELSLPQLSHLVHYYKLYLDPIVCSKAEHHASITFSVAWSNENYHGFVTNSEQKPFNIRLFSSKPTGLSNSSMIKLILDPSCTYKISIEYSIIGSLEQLARIYTPLLMANMAAVTLMTLRHQIKNLQKGYCSILFTTLQEGAKPYYVLTACKLISKLLSLWFIPTFIPRPDYLYMISDGIGFFFLPLWLYLCSVGILWILSMIFIVSLVALESTVHKISLMLLARTVSFNMVWSDYLLGYLHKIPFIVALILICLSVGACGGLALCLGAAFYFLRLTQMSQDFVEEVVWFFIKKIGRKFKAFLSRSKTKSRSQVINTLQKTETRYRTQIVGDIDGSEDSETTRKNDVQKLEAMNVGDGDKESRNDKKKGCEIVSDEKKEYLKDRIDSKVIEEKQNLNDNGQIHECDDQNVKTQEVSPDKSDLEEKIETVTENSEEIDKEMVPVIKKRCSKGGTSKDGDFDLSSYNAIFFHSTIFFLWCIVAVINFPAVLTWAHNFKYSTVLVPDESLIPGLCLSFCALALWQFDFPKKNRKWMKEMEKFLMAMAVGSLVFAEISIYRLNYIIILTIVLITLQQLLAPEINVSDEDKSEPTEKPEYSDLKMKME